jgi:hypothetical protein
MGETLMQQRRVSEEGPWVVKLFSEERRFSGLIALGADGTSRISTG